MSLINDALRKARQAASERSAQKSDTPFRGARLYPARQPRSGRRLAVVALIAAAAALAGASAAWWAAGRQDARHGFSKGTRQAAVPVGERPGGASAGSAPVDLPDDRETEPAISDAGAAAPAHSPAIKETPAPDSSSPPPSQAQHLSPSTLAEPAADSPRTETSTGQGKRPSGSTGRDRVFVLEADLGYATLSLDYIVFRPKDPFAEINGIEVHEGWFVDDFVVDKIERDRVLLHDEKGPLVLRVP